MIGRMKRLPIAVVALILALLSPAVAKEPDELAAGIGRLAKPLIEGKIVSGMAVGVIRGEEVRRLSFGKLPAGVDSVFEIGSITKVFTAYLLADMVRDGSVKLDQPVRELLPEGTTVPKHGDREITLRDLATHRSGLPRMPTNFAPKDRSKPYADYDEKRLYEYLKTAKLVSKPGEKKAYSNVGVGLLGTALARKAGMSYAALVAERITKPLKMTDTAIALSEDMKKQLAPGYDADLNPESNWDLDALAGAGAIRSAVLDMLAFLAAHFTTKDGVPDMTLGWQTGALEGSFWHNGQTGGYHGMAIVVPGKKMAVIVLADTATMRIDGLGGQIARLLAGEKVEPMKVRRPVEVDAKVLETYVGRYRFGEKVVMEVSRDDRGLVARFPDRQKRRLYAVNDTTFFLRVAPVTVVFEKDESGKVVRLVVRQKGREQAAERIAEDQ
jgi:CubicO group peptidase (beta-lactamase class C family)